MASTVTASTLTVSLSESITLNGQELGATNTKTIASINEVSKRIISILHTSEVEIVGMSTAVSSGTFHEDDVRYIRVTNLDDTNHVVLTCKDEDATEFAVLLDSGQSFIYNADLVGGVKNTMHAGGSALTVSLNDLVNITALADTATVDLEVFVASV